jgi:hypothetical protein
MLSLCLGVCKEVNGRGFRGRGAEKNREIFVDIFLSANKRNLRIYLCSLI